jgi:DNA replication protein DnaC
LREIKDKNISHVKMITQIIENEYECKKEKQLITRLKNTKIQERFVIDTYPFDRQPKLKKKAILELYDSLSYIKENQDLIFIGPTGSGKTGLAISFLIHAVNNGYRGLFIEFPELIRKLHQSRGDHTEEKILKRFLQQDILLIDEIGYDPVTREQASIFSELLRRRHKNNTTILTTQLGFDEWEKFLCDKHITAALLDRITVNCTVFNMKNCNSIRSKNIKYGADS